MIFVVLTIDLQACNILALCMSQCIRNSVNNDCLSYHFSKVNMAYSKYVIGILQRAKGGLIMMYYSRSRERSGQATSLASF